MSILNKHEMVMMITRKLLKKCPLFQGMIELVSVFTARHRDYAVYTQKLLAGRECGINAFCILTALNCLWNVSCKVNSTYLCILLHYKGASQQRHNGDNLNFALYMPFWKSTHTQKKDSDWIFFLIYFP